MSVSVCPRGDRVGCGRGGNEETYSDECEEPAGGEEPSADDIGRPMHAEVDTGSADGKRDRHDAERSGPADLCPSGGKHNNHGERALTRNGLGGMAGREGRAGCCNEAVRHGRAWPANDLFRDRDEDGSSDRADGHEAGVEVAVAAKEHRRGHHDHD
jgi:hypothetical protein